ncbi:hypothetical protein C8Q74DRAFT_1441993 [Fomes fomentarius]|nr:hypothetical protein C8Q74DRAFT_1441993 [Fomes fomentarius]
MHLPVLHKLIQHTRTRETLRVLWFDDGMFEWQSIAELGNIFQAVGPSGCLKRIILGPLDIFERQSIDTEQWDELQIGCCQGLEELHFHTRVVLRVHVDLFATLPPRQWEEFDAAFSGPQFSHVMLALETSPGPKEKLNANNYAELMGRVMNGFKSLRAQGCNQHESDGMSGVHESSLGSLCPQVKVDQTWYEFNQSIRQSILAETSETEQMSDEIWTGALPPTAERQQRAFSRPTNMPSIVKLVKVLRGTSQLAEAREA